MKAYSVGVMLGVGENPEESISKALEVGVDNVQLGCPPDQYLRGEGEQKLRQAIKQSGLTVTTVFCGFAGESYADIPTVQRTVGFINRETRAARIQKTKQIADFAKRLGVNQVAAHIGFIPEDHTDPLYQEVVEVLGEICDYCQKNGQSFCLETGQETASTLKRFIHDVGRENLKVNFDPANMILYGTGNPIEALDVVKDYVVSVHCKDGRWPTAEGQLGTEYPLGEGEVGMASFIQKLKEIGYHGPLTIEREISGEEQKRDIIQGKQLLERLVG